MSEAQTGGTQTTDQTISTTESGAGGGGGAAAHFADTFASENLRTHPSVRTFADTEALANGFVNLEKRLGVPADRRLDLPASADDKEGWAAVWRKLGAPEKPDDYKFQLADGSNDGDRAMADKFAAFAHAQNMPKSLADAAVKFWEGETIAAAAAAEAAAVEARKTGEATLRTEWGAAYEQKGLEIGRLLNKLGGPDIAKALEGEGLANHPQLALVLGKALDLIAEPDRMTGAAGEGAAGERVLTPVQARAKERELSTHPAFLDRRHPQHAQIMADITKYRRMAANLPVEDAR